MTIADILARRSIRRYTSEPISQADLQQLLQVAMAAPSAMHCDPFEIIVLQERKAIDALAESLPNGKMLQGAPLALIFCGDQAKAHAQSLSYLLQDVSAAVENTLLAAHALNLGACWLGVHPREERITQIRTTFGIPAEITPIAALSIGHPAERPAPRTRFVSERIHQEQW